MSATVKFEQIPSSSQLYRRAAGVEQKGTPLAAPCQCAMCAAQLQVGDLAKLVTKDTFDKGFNNKLDIHHRGGDFVCGDCAALWSKDYLQSYSKSYATTKGVFKLSSNEDVQAFLLSPPSPPFVAIFNTRQQQHMIWRTPVCLSQDVMIVRVDDELIHIRRQLALDGARAWRSIESCMKVIGIKGLPARLERTLCDEGMGVIRPDVIKAALAHSPASAKAIGVLQTMRVGEWWALCALRHIDQDAPSTWPTPIQVLPLAPGAPGLPVEVDD
ncbi:type IV CRISPR-associated protein Csf1 [Rhodoferax ferrireducens]|nr:type IV CRISPR-associated protein Csf1 [Rhodoferax ferrireducens]